MLHLEKNLKLKRPTTYFLSGDEGVDDEYYINEIIGIEEFTYEDWIGNVTRKEKKKDE